MAKKVLVKELRDYIDLCLKTEAGNLGKQLPKLYSPAHLGAIKRGLDALTEVLPELGKKVWDMLPQELRHEIVWTDYPGATYPVNKK